MVLKILSLPRERAYETMLSELPEMVEEREKLYTESYVETLDENLNCLRSFPTTTVLVQQYLPVIVSGYQFIYACSFDTPKNEKKLIFNSHRVKYLDASFQEMTVDILNNFIGISIQIFKDLLLSREESKHAILQKMVKTFLPLLKTFPKDVSSVRTETSANISENLSLFYEVCDGVTLDEGFRISIENVYFTLQDVMKKIVLHEEHIDPKDERVLFMLAGGLLRKYQLRKS